jgi:lactoylglutathione lyase
LNDSTIQRFNASTVQRFNGSTLQRFNDSTLQRFNGSTLQHFNASTLQRFNPSHHDCVGGIRRYCERMSKVKKLLHTRYRVDDLERTVKFYKDVLGLEEVRRHTSPRGSQLAFLKTPGSEELIEITCFPGSGPVQVQPDLTHLAFEVDSLDAFGKHLATLGIQYSDGPHMKPEGGGIAFIDAPEGYEVELIEMAEGGPGY